MTSSHRRAYVDWARGIAVLLMIEAHTSDAWTRLSPTVRRTIPFRDATVLGGFAAPLFLWLAGLAVVLAATRMAERTGSRRAAVEMICRRGLEIFILGFLFRLQGFIITPGSHPVTLFRVDILNIMGPAIALAGLVWGLARSAAARVWWYAAAATAIAMVTPIIRISSTVNALPLWFQWYIRPFNEFTIFTLFPWAGFVFAGGAVGALIAASREERAERRLHAVLGAIGVALVVVGFYTAGRPTIYAAANFWTSSPTWFAIRVGIMMIALTAIYGVEVVYAALKRRATQGAGLKSRATSMGVASGFNEVVAPGFNEVVAPGFNEVVAPGFNGVVAPGFNEVVAQGFSLAVDPLAAMGRNSLFIYWIHVELVYGYASWGWRHRLPLWGTAIGFVLFSVLMYRAIGWRDAAVTKWRNRSRRSPQTSQAATA